MSIIQRIFWGHMLVAVAALAIGYARTGLLLGPLVFVFLGLLWFSAQQRRAEGLAGFLLYIFVLAAGIGFYSGLPGWLMLIAAVATLGAWDLDHFLQRLGAVSNANFETGLGRAHLRRLGLAEILGLLLGLVALTTHASISFWWEALLVLIAVFGVRQVIIYVRRQAEK